MPRWIIEYTEPDPQPRGYLDVNVFHVEDMLKGDIRHIFRMGKSNTFFVLTPESLEYYNNVVEKEIYARKEELGAFGGRYLNYDISFADIMMVK